MVDTYPTYSVPSLEINNNLNRNLDSGLVPTISEQDAREGSSLAKDLYIPACLICCFPCDTHDKQIWYDETDPRNNGNYKEFSVSVIVMQVKKELSLQLVQNYVSHSHEGKVCTSLTELIELQTKSHWWYTHQSFPWLTNNPY